MEENEPRDQPGGSPGIDPYEKAIKILLLAIAALAVALATEVLTRVAK